MKSTKIVLVNSILWAAAMLGSAILLKDSGSYDNMFLLLFSLWFVSYLTLEVDRESIECEWRVIRKLFKSLWKSDKTA